MLMQRLHINSVIQAASTLPTRCGDNPKHLDMIKSHRKSLMNSSLSHKIGTLIYANYIINPVAGSLDTFRLTASYHRQEEGRNEVKRNDTSRRQRYDTVNTIGFSSQAVSSILPRQRLVGGGEFYLDMLQSRTVKTDIKTGKEGVDENLGRFINGSQFWDASLYLQDEIKIHDRVELTLGGRATFYQTNADLRLRDPSFDEFNVFDNSLTGSAGVLVGLTDSLNFVSTFGTAFPRPRRLNDTTAVEVTNEGVSRHRALIWRPETSWTAESRFQGTDMTTSVVP